MALQTQSQSLSSLQFSEYETTGFYDELFFEDGHPRARAELLAARLRSLSDGELQRRQKSADLELLNMGITFNVYGDEAGTEKIWPFGLMPRIIESSEWKFIGDGLRRRSTALKMSIEAISHGQNNVRDR